MLDDFPAPLRDRLEPLAVLGEGGMGKVYAARDRRLDRELAVKVLREVRDDELVQRFEQESAVLARLRDPHIVEVYEHGLLEDCAFILMERLHGPSLAAQLADAGPMAPERISEALDWMEAIGHGLDVVHEADLVHRDLKLANVVLVPGRGPVLLDFGLARVRGQYLTRTGAVVGTAGYMAPECLERQPAEAASDWYSWGVCLFELLEGRLPYDLAAITEGLRGEAMPPPEFQRIPRGHPLRRALPRLLARNPGDRPTGVETVTDLLAELGSSEFPRVPTDALAASQMVTREVRPTPRPGEAPTNRRRAALAGTVLVAALGVGLWQGAPAVDVGGPVPTTAADPAEDADEAEARAAVHAALDRLLEVHAVEGAGTGEGRFTLLGRHDYRGYLEATTRSYLDPRMPLLWRRYFQALARWRDARRAPEQPGDLDDFSRQLVLPATDLLSFDVGIMDFRTYTPLTAIGKILAPENVYDFIPPPTDEDKQRLEVFRAEVRDELGQVLGDPTPDPDWDTAWLIARSGLAGIFQQEGLHQLMQPLEQHLAATRDPQARAWLHIARMNIFSDNLGESGGGLGREQLDQAYLAAVDELPGLVEALQDQGGPLAARLAGYTLIRWFAWIQRARTHADAAEVEVFHRVLEVCEGYQGPEPERVWSSAHGARWYSDLVVLQTPIRVPFDDERTRLEALLDRLRDR